MDEHQTNIGTHIRTGQTSGLDKHVSHPILLENTTQDKQKPKIRHRDIIQSLCAFHRTGRRREGVRRRVCKGMGRSPIGGPSHHRNLPVTPKVTTHCRAHGRVKGGGRRERQVVHAMEMRKATTHAAINECLMPLAHTVTSQNSVRNTTGPHRRCT